MVFNFSYSSSDEEDPTPPESFSLKELPDAINHFSHGNFSLKELQDATNHFSHGNIVGAGDFGTVYRGRLADGSLVAVKRAVTIDQEREEIFEREMKVASSIAMHPNMLNLRGFCRTKGELLLVYPFMIHNSLASNLGKQLGRSTGPLNWTTHKRVALGAARGLAHLHDQGNFSLKELQDATNHFSHGNIVGAGDFGTVYRGRLADGSLVAVKRAVTIDQEREEIFEREMKVASSIAMHPNVLNLRGFCRTKGELLLVYPFMIHNSLASNLGKQLGRSTGPLNWTTRKRIALGAARGLAHLHDQGNVRIMHRHICPHTILLNAKLEAVIAGFCSAVIMHERNGQEGTIKSQVGDSVASGSSSQTYHCYDDVYVDDLIHSVIGYTAPEYEYTGKCTLKNDIFAFGRTLLVLIFGLATGDLFPLAFGKYIVPEEQMDGCIIKNKLKTWIDPELQGNYVEVEAEGLVRLALLCTHNDPSVRPKMPQVIRMLESQLLGQDPSASSRSSWSQTEHDSTPYYFPPSPSSEAAP